MWICRPSSSAFAWDSNPKASGRAAPRSLIVSNDGAARCFELVKIAERHLLTPPGSSLAARPDDPRCVRGHRDMSRASNPERKVKRVNHVIRNSAGFLWIPGCGDDVAE